MISMAYAALLCYYKDTQKQRAGVESATQGFPCATGISVLKTKR